MTDPQEDIRAAQDELDAIARLSVDVDGNKFFVFLERRLRALDAKTRKMFGEQLYHTNGRRSELADVLDLVKVSRGNRSVAESGARETRPAAVAPPKPLQGVGQW